MSSAGLVGRPGRAWALLLPVIQREVRVRRLTIAVCSVLSVTMVGCSLFNGQEGFLDRAAAKDTREGLMIQQCTQRVYNEVCYPDPKSPECRKRCG